MSPLWSRGHTRLRERGWGAQFIRGEKHCGTVGIYVLCGHTPSHIFEGRNNLNFFEFDLWKLTRIDSDKKENQIFLIYKEIQSGAVAKSYVRKSFLIYDEMRKYFPTYEEAVSHI